MHIDMESQIHHLEQEAYGAVLRAFKAQSDALTWEKEGLITELRKELRVSDDEHRDLLTRVNADDIICRIREWRKAGGTHSTMLNVSQPVHDQLASPTISGSRKKQKTSQNMPLSFGIPSQAMHPQSIAPTKQPSSFAPKWGPSSGPGGRRPKPGQPRHGLSSTNTGYPSTGGTPRGQFSNQGSAFNLTNDPLIGRKVMTRWPEDNNFYEAVITKYNPIEEYIWTTHLATNFTSLKHGETFSVTKIRAKGVVCIQAGRHALVYDRDTPNESIEWVNLKEIPREDIRWVDEDPLSSRHSGRVMQGLGVANPISHGVLPSEGRVRGASNLFEKEFPPLQNGVGNKVSEDIEILHTDTLIKEVEKVFGSNHPDLFEIEKAKKMLKDHEQALIDVIAKLADASDSESDGGEQEQQLLDGQSVLVLDEGGGPRYQQYTRTKGSRDSGHQNQDDDDDIIDIE